MTKDSLGVRGPAFPSSSQVFNAVAKSSAAPPHHQTEAPCGSTTFEVSGSEGLSKPHVQSSPTETELRKQAQKLNAKATPYTSKHGVSGVELNCEVQVRTSESFLDSKPVVCRHLATRFATYAGKKSELMLSFSEEESIAAEFDGKLTEIHDTYEKCLRDAPSGCKHLVSSDQLGQYIKAMATQLQAPGSRLGPSQANCLLITVGHAMALHLERKSRNSEAYFSAKLYDPNATATYRRVEKRTPQDFGDLKLKDMMILPQLLSRYAGGENKLLSMAAVSLDDRLQPPMDRSDPRPSAENMLVALKFGLVEEVQSILKFALEGGEPPDKHIELLQASSLDDGLIVPGIFKAFCRGFSDAIRVFSEAVLASNLSPQAKLHLLTAKRSDGVPGLDMAFQDGHSDAVKAFAQVVLASPDLTSQNKFGLLAAKDLDGTPGFYMALQEGNADTVEVFAQEVLSSQDLNSHDKVGLLAATDGGGTPGLFMALENGHAEAVRAYAREVLASKDSTSQDLTSQDKVGLLAAKDIDGTPGLYMALQEGNADAVKAFAQEVLASKDLSSEDKVGLLAAKTADGVPGLLSALQEGNLDAVKAFVDEVSASDLSKEAKDSLLSDMSGIDPSVFDLETSSTEGIASQHSSSQPPADPTDRVETKRQRTG